MQLEKCLPSIAVLQQDIDNEVMVGREYFFNKLLI